MNQKKNNSLSHYGILGMKWGVCRYQNADGTLTEAGKKRYIKSDTKWANKNETKIRKQAYKNISEEMDSYAKDLFNKKGAINENGTLTDKTINSYNKKMADLMNESLTDVKTDTGSSVYFVADIGTLGVRMTMENDAYIMQQFTINKSTGQKSWFYTDELE